MHGLQRKAGPLCAGAPLLRAFRDIALYSVFGNDLLKPLAGRSGVRPENLHLRNIAGDAVDMAHHDIKRRPVPELLLVGEPPLGVLEHQKPMISAAVGQLAPAARTARRDLVPSV